MTRQLSGQIVVATAGTAVAGPDVEGEYFALKGHPSNTGTVWVGNDGNDDVSNAVGFPLDPANAQSGDLMFRAAFATTADLYGDDFSVRQVEQ
jgi:hypothetical protein